MNVICTQNYILNRKKQALLLEGELYSIEQIKAKAKQYNTQGAAGIYYDLFMFLQEWFDDNAHIHVKTSGSTGQPKIMAVEKDKMLNSAVMTCSFFELYKNASTLLCMPLQYIGAKMLVVRALVAGLDLYVVNPSTNPLQNIDNHFDFVPMTPQQLQCSLECQDSIKKINNIQHLLLGGMAVSKELEQKCANLLCNVWSSYGMTETLSHIALRKINHAQNGKVAISKSINANTLNQSPYFTPLDGVSISLSEQDTLIIDAPMVSTQRVYTNDIVKVNHDNTFAVLGRLDNIINSGGIKIPLEVLEAQLASCLDVPLQVTAMPDDSLGERVVLLLEKEYVNWKEKCQIINKYWLPKQVYIVDTLPLTKTHKPDRMQAKLLALQAAEKNFE